MRTSPTSAARSCLVGEEDLPHIRRDTRPPPPSAPDGRRSVLGGWPLPRLPSGLPFPRCLMGAGAFWALAAARAAGPPPLPSAPDGRRSVLGAGLLLGLPGG